MELSEKCVGGLNWLLKGNEERKGRRWKNLIFLSYLFMRQKCSTNFFLKVIK